MTTYAVLNSKVRSELYHTWPFWGLSGLCKSQWCLDYKEASSLGQFWACLWQRNEGGLRTAESFLGQTISILCKSHLQELRSSVDLTQSAWAISGVFKNTNEHLCPIGFKQKQTPRLPGHCWGEPSETKRKLP